MKKWIGLCVLIMPFWGCKRGSDLDLGARFILESAAFTLNPLGEANLDYPGIPGVMNLDDDNQDGVADWEESSLSDVENDLTELVLYSTGDPLEIQLSGGEVRLWSEGELVLEGEGTWSPTPSEVIVIEVEFGDMLASTQMTVTDLDSEEQVQTYLTASPMMLSHHNLVTETVWVMGVYEYGYSNGAMVAALGEVLGDRLIEVNPAPYDYDVWVQDEFEMATFTSPESRLDIAIDSIRDGQSGGGLDDLPEDYVNGPNQIVRTWGSGTASTFDSFGNLEVTPAMEINGVDYPVGRIYYGGKGAYAPVKALTDQLDSQQIQAPIAIDTSWLCVGHIDEFTTFVPDPTAPRGFRFVYADTTSAWEILDAADPDQRLPRYAPKNPYQGHNIKTVGEMVNYRGLRAYNQDIQSNYLDPILDQFVQELALTEDEIVRLPTLFKEELYNSGVCGAVALIPGAINMLVVNNEDGSSHAFMADPFFREDITSQAGDPFIAAYDSVLPDSIQTHYVDDFSVYHLNLGEVHCGTNSRRTPTGEWWETAAGIMTEGE